MSTISINARRKVDWLFAILVACAPASADQVDYHLDGHTKGRLLAQSFPGNSVFESVAGANSFDLEGDLRLNLEVDKGAWTFKSAYQLGAFYGDRIDYSRDLPDLTVLLSDRLPNDRRRYFDLTRELYDEGSAAAVHRLDRLWVAYTKGNLVLRAGRQAISWGNGYFYAPMDIVNPFDPATIDTEYKAGDDMLYAQYLLNNGHDLQAASVFRRNGVTGEAGSSETTYTAKYHGIAGAYEFDLLAAQSYGDAMIGIGGNRSVGGAVLGGDVVVTDSEGSAILQLVGNVSYSWTWKSKNITGVAEYYYNGFGQADRNYDPTSLAQNPALLERIARGELFTLARNYVAGSISVEMTPLWTTSPSVLVNLDDPSAFLQLISQYSLADNATLLAALNIPVGPDGSEYGGIASGQANLYFSTGIGAFLQLAWYF